MKRPNYLLVRRVGATRWEEVHYANSRTSLELAVSHLITRKICFAEELRVLVNEGRGYWRIERVGSQLALDFKED